MTKILFWNINNFSLNKIFDTSAPDESLERRLHIIYDVFGQNVPDIFVIVEVFVRTTEVEAQGTVIETSANVGCAVWELLNYIRDEHGDQWCLVPPLKLGDFGHREAVAVFYDSSKLQFIGPYVWGTDYRTVTISRRGQPQQGANVRACPFASSQKPAAYPFPGSNGPLNYPGGWSGAFPNPNRVVPAGFPNQGQAENRLAGQWEFYAGNQQIFFPDKYNRSPFLTEFIDLTQGNRIIKLFAVHTSPDTAFQAVQNLDLISEIQNVGNNEVSVIVGDFNVDTFATNVNAAYTPLLNRGYTLHLDPKAPGGNINNNRKPYCMTHLLPVGDATPFNNTGGVTDPQHNVYPRFGYMGSKGGQNYQQVVDTGAIDNILTRYGPGTPQPANHNMTVANTIAGTPYNLVPAPAGVDAKLTGGLNYGRAFFYGDALPIPHGVAPNVGIGDFRVWENYGVIYSTSDHLALIIDV